MNEMQCRQLLEKSAKIINDYRSKSQDSGNCFNLFAITGIQSDEVKVCRMLAEILNPAGTHFLGTLFLESFIKKVLDIPIEDDELHGARVYTEYHTDSERRIDIVISTPYRWIPIEVKIYAGDQAAQCADYYAFAKKRNKKYGSKVYYLTLQGHLPRDAGSRGLTEIRQNSELIGYQEIIPLSFAADVCPWLDRCLNEAAVLNKPMIFLNLKQFKNTLEELCGTMHTEITEHLLTTISENSQALEAACAIADHISRAKTDMLCKVLRTLEERIQETGLLPEQLSNKFDYKYHNYDAVTNFCGRKRTFPALCYRYKKVDETKEIWFLVEAGWNNLYCGFVIAENQDTPGRLVLSHDEIQKHIQTPRGFREETWWFYWEYLVNDDERTSPDFLHHNDALFRLFDRADFDAFIEKCITQIQLLLRDMPPVCG